MSKKRNKKASSTSMFILIFMVLFIIIGGSIVVIASMINSNDKATPVRDYNFSISSLDVEIDVKENRVFATTQRIEIDVHNLMRGIIVEIPVDGGERVRNLVAKGDEATIYHESNNRLVCVRFGESDTYLNVGDTVVYTLQYDYIIPPDAGDKTLNYMALGQGWATDIDSYNLTMNFFNELPQADESVFNMKSYSGVVDRELTESEAVWSKTDNRSTLNISVTDIPAFCGINMLTPVPDGMFKAYHENSIIWISVIGVVLAILAIVLKRALFKNEELTPVVTFYPPKKSSGKEMTPIELGMVIDSMVSAEDVTSMIYYWASKGYLSVTDDNGKILLDKLQNIPDDEFCSSLFNEIFKLGFVPTNSEVSVDPFEESTASVDPFAESTEIDDSRKGTNKKQTSLKRLDITGVKDGELLSSITKAKSEAIKEYRGILYTKKSIVTSCVLSCLVIAYAILTVLFIGFKLSFDAFNGYAFLAIIPWFLSGLVGFVIVKYYFKLTNKKRIWAIIAHAFIAICTGGIVAILSPADMISVIEQVILGVCVTISTFITPYILCRTKDYTTLLNEVVGFRDFLRDVEKEKLEALIQDDPQYYYDILPYANVLGVSDIWEEKFSSITIEPPRYYHSTSNVIFNMYLFNSLSRSMNSKFMSTTKGSGFGGGGSFSGGSFGGGSFGGGGGHSW